MRSFTARTQPTSWLLGAVLGLALVLRVAGIAWGLPWTFHPDESHYPAIAEAMVRNSDPNPKYFLNPSLFTYLIAGELLVTRTLGPEAGPLEPSVPGAPYLLARLDSALFGTATVALVYAIGATLFTRPVGLVAALFLAVSFLHVRDSHYGVNDVPATALLLLSTYFAANLLRQPRLRWYLLAGLAGGLATSTKYNMGLFFLPFLIAHCLATWNQGRRPWDRPAVLMLGAAAASSLAGYLIGTPYTLLAFGHFWTDFRAQYGFGDVRWRGQALEPVPLLYLLTFLHGFGALMLALAAIGLALIPRLRRAETVVLLTFPVAYLVFMLPKALFFPRLALPLVPFLSLLAALGAIGLVARLPSAGRPLGLMALLTLAVAQPLANNMLHTGLLLRPDTRVLANEWLQDNLPPGSRVAGEFLFSIFDTSGYVPRENTLRFVRISGSDSAEEVRAFVEREVQSELEYIVLSSFVRDRYLLGSLRPSDEVAGRRYEQLHAAVEERAEFVTRFGPGPGGRDAPYWLDNLVTPFWGLDNYERPGPTMRIFRLLNYRPNLGDS